LKRTKPKVGGHKASVDVHESLRETSELLLLSEGMKEDRREEVSVELKRRRRRNETERTREREGSKVLEDSSSSLS